MSLRHDSRRHGGYELVCASTSVTLAEVFLQARHFGHAYLQPRSGRRTSKEEVALEGFPNGISTRSRVIPATFSGSADASARCGGGENERIRTYIRYDVVWKLLRIGVVCLIGCSKRSCA